MPDGDDLMTVTLYYRDRWGHKQELRVSKATRRAVETIRKAYSRACRRWDDRMVTMTDLGSGRDGQPGPDADVTHDRMAARIAKRRQLDNSGMPWEGPRFSFTRLLGETRIWPLPATPDGSCPLCGGESLPECTYCLGCDASGRDGEIRRPTKAELARLAMIMPRANDGLAGGTSGTDRRRSRRACAPAEPRA